jgi:hypothetical protein
LADPFLLVQLEDVVVVVEGGQRVDEIGATGAAARTEGKETRGEPRRSRRRHDTERKRGQTGET